MIRTEQKCVNLTPIMKDFMDAEDELKEASRNFILPLKS